MVYQCDATRKRLATVVDKFGDHYTRPTTTDELAETLERVGAATVQPCALCATLRSPPRQPVQMKDLPPGEGEETDAATIIATGLTDLEALDLKPTYSVVPCCMRLVGPVLLTPRLCLLDGLCACQPGLFCGVCDLL